MEITHCPSCGSDKIKKARGTIHREYKGARYSVPNVDYYICPNCGERIYDRVAVRKVLAKSPAFDVHEASR